MPSLKVTNPEDPRFDPESFDFYDYYINNYEYYEKTCEVVKKIITRKLYQDRVNKILIDSGGAYLIQNEETRKSYLNPIEIGKYIPLNIYRKNYQAQLFVVQFTSEGKVNNITCLKETGSRAKNIYETARKIGNRNGSDIHN